MPLFRLNTARAAVPLLFAFSSLIAFGSSVSRARAWQDNKPTRMLYPLDVAVGKDGVVYVADRNLPGIWSIKDGKLDVFFQGQKKFRTPLNAVRCVAIDKDGKLLAGDSATRAVYRFDGGKPVKLTKGKFGIGIPMALAVNGAGEILVADLELKRIWKLPSEGGEAALVATVPAPRGLAVDKDDRIWVLSNEAKADQLLRLDADGKPVAVLKGRKFRFPHQVVLGEAGVAYISDGYGKAVWKLDRDGDEPVKLTSDGPFKNPVGLALAGEDLLVADPHAKNVFRIKASGEVEPLVK